MFIVQHLKVLNFSTFQQVSTFTSELKHIKPVGTHETFNTLAHFEESSVKSENGSIIQIRCHKWLAYTYM